jgi:hypothetical protein
MKKLFLCASLLSTTLCAPAIASTEAIMLGDFSRYNSLPQEPWQLVRFDDKIPATQYHLRQHQGISAVEARADASMALLARPLQVELEQTPVLCWRWWVDSPIEQADMTSKAGDDYAARVYVTFHLPDSAMSFGTRMKLGLARAVHGEDLPDAAINYIWDNRHPIGTAAANAYTDRAQMLVLRSGSQDTGRWVEERRNLLTDLQQLFGARSARTLQLAVASDSDNTGARTGALFADLHLVTAEARCRFPATATSQPNPNNLTDTNEN